MDLKKYAAAYVYLLGILVFTLMDVAAKHLSGQLPLSHLMAMRALFGFIPVLVLVALEARKTKLIQLKSKCFWWQVARGINVALVVASFFAALSLLPYADLVGITLIAPILMMITGVVFLAEPFRLASLLWVLVGLFGVLLIVRPSGEIQSVVGVLLALFSATFYALGATLTRAISAYDSNAISSLYSNVTLSLIVVVWLVFEPWQGMSSIQWAFGSLIGIAGGVGNILIIVAFSIGAVSRLGVLEYSAYVWALIFGYFVFAEQPHTWALIGTGLVVVSGYRVTRVSQVA